MEKERQLKVQGLKTCWKCGKQLDVKDAFCKYCGSKVYSKKSELK